MQTKILSLLLIFCQCIPAFAKVGVSTSPPSVIYVPKQKGKTRKNLIKWISPDWVDVNRKSGLTKMEGSITDGLGLGNADSQSKLFGNATGSGNSSGQGGIGSQGYNENASRNGNSVDPGPKSGNPTRPDNGKTPPLPPDKGKELTFWMPICFFFDPSVRSEQEANQIVKTVVDNFGKCDVAVYPVPLTLEPDYNPNDPEEINSNAKIKCNANQAFQVEGTAVQTHPNSMEAADKMCGQKPEDPYSTAGCSELGNKGGSSAADFVKGRNAGQGGYGSAGGGGTPAASICDVEGGGAATHELGHSVGGPGQGGDYLVNKGDGTKGSNGESPPDAGEGLEYQSYKKTSSLTAPSKVFYASGPTGSLGSGFTNPAGCMAIRGGANLNKDKRKWYPERVNYYRQAAPGKGIHLLDKKPFWGSKPDVINPEIPPMIGRGDSSVPDIRKTPPGFQPDDPKFVGNGQPNSQNPASRIGRADDPKKEIPGSKHKKAPGISKLQDAISAVIANSETSIPPSLPPVKDLQDSALNDPRLLPPAANLSGPGAQKSFSTGYNESNAKGQSDSSAANFFSAQSKPPGGSSTSYNEINAKNGSSISSSEVAERIGREGTGPLTISGAANAGRKPASLAEEDKENPDGTKKRPQAKARRGNGTRKPGTALRQGKSNTVDLYQSSGFSDL